MRAPAAALPPPSSLQKANGHLLILIKVNTCLGDLSNLLSTTLTSHGHDTNYGVGIVGDLSDSRCQRSWNKRRRFRQGDEKDGELL